MNIFIEFLGRIKFFSYVYKLFYSLLNNKFFCIIIFHFSSSALMKFLKGRSLVTNMVTIVILIIGITTCKDRIDNPVQSGRALS